MRKQKLIYYDSDKKPLPSRKGAEYKTCPRCRDGMAHVNHMKGICAKCWSIEPGCERQITITEKENYELLLKLKFAAEAVLDMKEFPDVSERYSKILFQDNNIVTTNRCAVHVARHESDIKNGLYNIIRNNKKSISIELCKDYTIDDYPDWRSIVPEKESDNDNSRKIYSDTELYCRIAEKSNQYYYKIIYFQSAMKHFQDIPCTWQITKHILRIDIAGLRCFAVIAPFTLRKQEY